MATVTYLNSNCWMFTVNKLVTGSLFKNYFLLPKWRVCHFKKMCILFVLILSATDFAKFSFRAKKKKLKKKHIAGCFDYRFPPELFWIYSESVNKWTYYILRRWYFKHEVLWGLENPLLHKLNGTQWDFHVHQAWSLV